MAPLILGVSMSNKHLIEEVKKRPAIYDRSMPEYNNLAMKNKAWKDIAETIFTDRWKSWNRGEQGNVVHAIQKRWNNLRTCFTRELRNQNKAEDGNHEGRRKYRYFNIMMFLRKHSSLIQRQNQSQDSEGYRSERSDNQEEWPEQYIETYHEDEDSGSAYSVPIKNAKIEFEAIDDPLINMNMIQKPEQVQIPIQNLDQDINFVMSLVPMFREMPVNEKLKMQVQILKLFQQAVK